MRLDREVSEYLTEIGDGYAHASMQRPLDMNVMNAYTEEYGDPPFGREST